MTFKTMLEFYDADPRRARSPEVDFGVWWYLGPRRIETHRVSFVDATGELYAFNQHTGTVAVIALFENRAHVERALEGWAQHCGDPESLDWLIKQACNVALEKLWGES